MLKRYRSAAIAVSALVLTSGVLFAAGNYSAYPIVGGGSFCLSTVGVNGQQGNTGQGGGAAGVAGAYCAQTVPAGPPALTGTELIPLDTGLAGGASPQSAVLPVTDLHAGYYQIVTTGTTVTVAPNVQNLILNLAATTMAVTLPAAPYDNEVVTISNSSTIVSTFSVTNNTGQTITQGAAPTSLAAQAANTAATAQSEVAYLYNASGSKWFRLH